jgi:hypothetical protein
MEGGEAVAVTYEAASFVEKCYDNQQQNVRSRLMAPYRVGKVIKTHKISVMNVKKSSD